MYTYIIRQNDYPIVKVLGKYRAFEVVQGLVSKKQQLGIWDGLECVTDTDRYVIERE